MISLEQAEIIYNNARGPFKSWRCFPSATRKVGHALEKNIIAFITQNGAANCLVLTLTTPVNALSDPATAKAHRNFFRTALPRVFSDWIIVREFSKRGHLHFHIVGAVGRNIRNGFSFHSHSCLTANPSSPMRLALRFEKVKQISSNSSFHALWQEVDRLRGQYRFGRFDLMPLRTNARALGRYLSKTFRNSLCCRPAAFKRCRLIRYSQRNWRRAWGNCFAYNTPFRRAHTRAQQLIATAFGLTRNEICQRLSRSWYFDLKPAIDALICLLLDGNTDLPDAAVRDLTLNCVGSNTSFGIRLSQAAAALPL